MLKSIAHLEQNTWDRVALRRLEEDSCTLKDHHLCITGLLYRGLSRGVTILLLCCVAGKARKKNGCLSGWRRRRLHFCPTAEQVLRLTIRYIKEIDKFLPQKTGPRSPSAKKYAHDLGDVIWNTSPVVFKRSRSAICHRIPRRRSPSSRMLCWTYVRRLLLLFSQNPKGTCLERSCLVQA